MFVLILLKHTEKGGMLHFISKLTDSDGENSETNVWLEFAYECNYINKEVFLDLSGKTQEVGKLINFMINNPEKFGCSIK